MNQQQATDLASTLATAHALELGDDYRVVCLNDDVSDTYWVVDNDEKHDDFDPSESTYFTVVESHTKTGVFVVMQNSTDGGGFIYLDFDTCFESAF